MSWQIRFYGFLSVYALLLLLGNGQYRLFDWDEINFAESSREMLITGDYGRVQINFEPFWEKPPLFFWLQSLSFHLFGINEWAARFPNSVFTWLSVWLIFAFGRKYLGDRHASLWAMIYASGLLPFFYGKSGIIDPVFNFFIFASILYLVKWRSEPVQARVKHALVSGVCLGFAVLTKGPAAALIVGGTFILIGAALRFRQFFEWRSFFLWIFSAVLVSLAWFGLEWIKNGPWFILTFVEYQIRLFSTPDAGHEQPFFYHFLVVMLGCFPFSWLALPQLFRKLRQDEELARWMLALFWVVMVIFSIAKTKIVHYSSMCYLPLSFLAFLGWLEWERGRVRRWQHYVLLFQGLLLSLAIMAIPWIDVLMKKNANNVKDSFAQAQMLADAGWDVWDGWPGLLLLTGVLLYALWMRKNQLHRAYASLATGLLLCLTSLTINVIPKIEQYTQGAYITFLESIAEEDAYVQVLGFKSYAHYFYSRKKELSASEARYVPAEREKWLLTGDIDKPVYFVSRNKNSAEYLAIQPALEPLGSKNGYVFYRRMP